MTLTCWTVKGDGKYQKSIAYNTLLPYYEGLEVEANELFEDIKFNLSLAVQRKELRPGAVYWTKRLRRYELRRVAHESDFEP